jgi:type IX secretion system PorP/SprF family membrane protein
MGFCLLGFTTLRGQHDTQINSYTFNQMFFNPACAGIEQRGEAKLLQRSQFIGFKGAPVVWDLAVGIPFEVDSTRHGAAFTLNSDEIGAFSKLHFAANYAYWLKMPDGARLGVGLSMGAVSYNFDPKWSGVIDDAIPTSSEAASTGFDANLGAYYQHPKWAVGFACTHLSQPEVLKQQTGEKTFLVKRTFYLNGEYRWTTPIENVEVVTSAMVMAINIVAPQLTMGANVFYKQKFWGGLSYRIGDALGISGGMLFKSVRFGLMYEYSLSRMIGFNAGSTEIFASYFFDVNLQKKKIRYKSIRFL